jgi:hypothetical protein
LDRIGLEIVGEGKAKRWFERIVDRLAGGD